MIFTRAELKIRNSLGLHARPAGKFVQLADKFKCKVSVTKDSEVVDGKSVMGMMTLAAAKGSRIIVEASGEDAAAAVQALEQLVKDKFGEE